MLPVVYPSLMIPLMYVLLWLLTSYFNGSYMEIAGQCCNTTANDLLDSSRPLVNYHASESANAMNNPSSSRVNGITNFFGWIGPPSDAKEKHKQPRLNRGPSNVVDVPLGQATYVCFSMLGQFMRSDCILCQGDYVASKEDGIRPYSLFFCLGWCRKHEKKPDLPPQVYDVDLMRAEQEYDTPEVPVHTSRHNDSLNSQRYTDTIP